MLVNVYAAILDILTTSIRWHLKSIKMWQTFRRTLTNQFLVTMILIISAVSMRHKWKIKSGYRLQGKAVWIKDSEYCFSVEPSQPLSLFGGCRHWRHRCQNCRAPDDTHVVMPDHGAHSRVWLDPASSRAKLVSFMQSVHLQMRTCFVSKEVFLCKCCPQVNFELFFDVVLTLL